MILDGEQQLDISSIQRAASLFATKNGFSEKAKSELLFVCKSFALFYNTCASRPEGYNLLQIFDLFDTNMEMQAIVGVETGNIGLETDALSLYKLVPFISNLYNQENRFKRLNKKEKENELLKKELKKQIEKTKQAEKEAQEAIERAKYSNNYSSGFSYSNGRC